MDRSNGPAPALSQYVAVQGARRGLGRKSCRETARSEAARSMLRGTAATTLHPDRQIDAMAIARPPPHILQPKRLRNLRRPRLTSVGLGRLPYWQRYFLHRFDPKQATSHHRVFPLQSTQPIFGLQIGNVCKVLLIIGHKDKILRKGMRGNQTVVTSASEWKGGI